MAMSVEQSTGSGEDLDLKKIIAVLWRRRGWILVSLALFYGIGSFQVASTYPVYQADTLVQLENRNKGINLGTSAPGILGMGSSATAAGTEIQIIQSRMVLGRAVAEHDLDRIVESVKAPLIGNILARYDLPIPDWLFLQKYARYGEALELKNLQVPPNWLGLPIILTTSGGDYRLELPDGSIHGAEVGKDFNLPEKNFSISIGELPQPEGRQFVLRQVSERAAITSLKNRLTIRELGVGTGILTLQLTGSSIQDAESTLGAVTTAYVQQNIRRSAVEAEGSVEFLQAQLPAAERRVKEAQLALSRFREEASSRAMSQEWLNEGGDRSFESQALLNQITRLESDLRSAKQQVEQYRTQYSDTHPMLRKSLDDQAKIEVELAKLLAMVAELPEVEQEIVNLTRDIELAQEIYLGLQSSYQEAQVLQASTVGSVWIIDQASASLAPVAPSKNIVIAFWILIGLLVGILLSLAVHFTRKGIRGSLEMEQLGIPVFATVPKSRHKRDGSSATILALEQPDDLAIEALRALRTSLHFGMIDSTTKAITVTSPAPGAGKTTTSVNLAVIAAQAGQAVALIDADMRRGQIRKYFGLERAAIGLSDVLARRHTLEAALSKTRVDGLSVMPSGSYPPNPAELLMSEDMSLLMAELSEKFDLIIFDAPPTLAVTDPVVLARVTGTTILIARHGITPLGEIRAVQKKFQSAGVTIAGAVLNGFDRRYADPAEAATGYDYQYSYRTVGRG